MNSRVIFNVLTIAMVGAVAGIVFQNCSGVKFSPGDTQLAAQLPPTVAKTCIDTDGVTRSDGESWVVTSPSQMELPCPDAPIRIQNYLNSQGYLCADGQIQPTASSVEPIDQVSDCPAPTLQASIDPNPAKEGATVQLSVFTQYVSQVKYTCSPTTPSPIPVAPVNGNLSVGSDKAPLVVVRDLTCAVEAVNSANVTLTASAQVQVDCGNRVKENGACREFECKKIEPLAETNGVYLVPARTDGELCYSIKLMNAIANSSSSLTTERDQEVFNRSHDQSNRGQNQAAYVLGKSKLKFLLAGTRSVKLSGKSSVPSSIKVDNYILSGIYPVGDAPTTAPLNFYRSYGTSDSTITGTNHILFRNEPIVLNSFGPSGTSTITPLDITADVKPLQLFELDLRALDCGGSRELTDIYLLFQ